MYNIFPFFLGCSKNCSPSKKKIYENLAFGKGAHIIERKAKHILITSNSEFVIPLVYYEEEQTKLEELLWPDSAFEQLASEMENYRSVWSTIKKKDKANLLYQFLTTCDNQKFVASFLILALYFKTIEENDVSYNGKKITKLSSSLISRHFDYDV